MWALIVEKMPVSISLGLWTFFISYLIAVPLGVAKAVRAGSRFDLATTLLVLFGYAIPGFVLGVALLVIFGGQLQWFPLRGLTSGNWDELSVGGKIVDYLWHITLPVTAMVVGSFAVTTMLTKNSFLEEIRKQYVLTARAKGLDERRVLWKHETKMPEDLSGLVKILSMNRGAALYGDRVYFGTMDARVVAVSATTGAVVWQTTLADYKDGYFFTMAPLAADGKIIVGSSGPGEMGNRGFIAALDANSGRELWRTYTIPAAGEPGVDTWSGETWR